MEYSRKIDDLGRIVLPLVLRESLGIAINESLKIFVDGNNIILQKEIPSCIVCQSAENLRHYKGRCLCEECHGMFGAKDVS